jgi:arginase
MTLALITVPYTSTGLTSGEARGPDALRQAGLLDALRGAGAEIADYGDIAFSPPTPDRDPVSGIIAPETLQEMVLAVQAEVARALAAEHFPLVVGGECPLLLGCLAAARNAHERVGLIFVDGHEDAWPPHASTTGEAADMELGLALGSSRAIGLPSLAALLPLVQVQDIVLLGPRDHVELADAGIDSLAESVRTYSDIEVRQMGPGALGKASVDCIRAQAGQWWFHLDLDVLSTRALCAVRYPQPGGLSWADLEQLTAEALHRPGPVGWNLTIYNPDLDPEHTDAARIVRFIADMANVVVRD